MSRVLVPQTRGSTGAASSLRDDSLDRLAAFLPAEILPLYVLVEVPLKGQDAATSIATLRPVAWMWVALLILAVFNILYLIRSYRQKYKGTMPRRVTITHCAMSTLAFLLYTYADRLPIWSTFYHPTIAAIAIAIFAAAAGFAVDPQVSPEEAQKLRLP
jgi:hypothetical protein